MCRSRAEIARECLEPIGIKLAQAKKRLALALELMVFSTN